MPRRTRFTILLALAALLCTAPQAQAGTYTVHSCTTPSGTHTSMEGWTNAASSPNVGNENGTVTACSSGTPLSLQFGTTGLTVLSGSWLRWTFGAPADTRIASVSLRRSFHLGWLVSPGVANRPYASHIWHDSDENEGLIDFQAPLQAGQTVTQNTPATIEQAGVEWRSLHVSLRCWGLVGSLNCASFPAQVAIPRATFTLRDTDAPVGVVAGGSLAQDEPLRGVEELSFHASDAGGGVYRSIVEIDGEEVAREPIDSADEQCADVEPGIGDAYEFGAAQPCPLSADGETSVDTATLEDGPHEFRVSVEDAAGNVAVVLDDTLVTHNAPIALAAPTLTGTPRVGQQLTATSGQWDGGPTTHGYRWLRCNADGGACAGIAGADEAAYTPTSADAYHRLRVEVTAANGSGAAIAASAASARIQDANGNATPPAGGTGGGSTPPGGIQGLVNPLAGAGGHVGNGANATGRARLEIAFRLPGGKRAQHVRSPHDRRWTIAGRLTAADGAGIGGARLGVAWKTMGSGAWVARGAVRTAADGRFAYVLPAGPSRQVKLTYFAFSDSRGFLVSNVVREDVLAPLTMRADRGRVGIDRTVRLEGRVGGGGAPARAGLLVTLQGYQAGYGWRTFRTLRTTRGGSWSTSYRFRLSQGRFGFRAVVPRQGGHPYVTTHSKPVYVTLG